MATTTKAMPYWAETNQVESSAWNTCILGKDFLPGICVVTAEKGRAVDIKKAKGQDGYTMTDNGMTAGKVTIVMTLVNKNDWLAWQQVRPRIDPNRPGGTRKPLEIVHPEPQDRGIQNVVVLNIKGAAPTARGGKVITIECTEWFAAPKPVKKKTAYNAEKADPQHLGLEERRTFIDSDSLATLPPTPEQWKLKF
jgi:hypothetical protein